MDTQTIVTLIFLILAILTGMAMGWTLKAGMGNE